MPVGALQWAYASERAGKWSIFQAKKNQKRRGLISLQLL